MMWNKIEPQAPSFPEGTILLANRRGILGIFSGYQPPSSLYSETWFIDDSLHDGDPPEFWLKLPEIPSSK